MGAAMTGRTEAEAEKPRLFSVQPPAHDVSPLTGAALVRCPKLNVRVLGEQCAKCAWRNLCGARP
jgi:hypothetical protein